MDTGDAAASRALQMEGGSLPPRKRLLAGLKLNGLLATSPPPVVSPTVESGARKGEDGCMGCNAVEANGLKRIKRGGVSLRLCSGCTLLYSKSMFCPHCLVMYLDASLLGDPSKWLVCTRCKRSVHPECEQKHSGSKPDAASYLCLDCVNSARRQREVNGVTGMRSKPGAGRSIETGVSPVDVLNPALKKPRMHRERRDHHGDGSRFERHRPSPDTPGVAKASSLGPPRKVVSSQAPPSGTEPAPASPQEAATAARNAAVAAAKVAAAAKANAAAKAGVAVKAAAAAKVALEAAAHAAKAEAACRAELRRKNGNSETKPTGPVKLQINVHSEPRRERTASMKHEREDGYGGRRPSVDDEELARQLHRVINSSPRISRSMTPMRRKNPSVKPETPSSGVSNSSAETGRARSRTNPSPVEPEARAHEPDQQHHQFRHQQTRPRSITHKEFRRIDTRVSRHEVKTADEGTGQQGVGGVDPPSQEAQPAMKSEAMEGMMFTPVGAQDDASCLFDALAEVDGEGMHAARAGQGSHDRRPDYLQEILEAAVLSDAGMFSDGTTHVVSDLDSVRPEPVAAEPLETASLQSEAGTRKDADGEPGDGIPRDAAKGIAGEVTVAVAGDTVASGDAMAVEAVDALAAEAAETMVAVAADSMAGAEALVAVATDTMAGDAAEEMAGDAADEMVAEAAETMAGEAAETTVSEVAGTTTGEATETMDGDAPETTTGEAAETKAGEVTEAMAVDVISPGQDVRNGSGVAHDVEMQEVGSVDASSPGGADETVPEPSSTSGVRVEESSGGEVAAAELKRIEVDASTPSTVETEVPLKETKSDAPKSEAHLASGVTATGSAAQQSG